MSRKTKEVTIDGVTYALTQLPAEQGMDLYHDLLKAIGNAVVESLPEVSKAGDMADVALATIVVKAVGTIPKELAKALRTAFKENTAIIVSASNGEKVPVPLLDRFDDHFAGNYGALLKWQMACLQHNYSNAFLVGTGSSQSATPSPETKTTE
jgi:hypothetical protein